MTHDHCDKCFRTECRQTSSCPSIYCPNGCSARMHECKRADHDSICPNLFTSCLNAKYGCPLTIRRSDLTRHLRTCPASIIVCSYIYAHEYRFNHLDDSTNTDLVQTIARRDNIWYEHMTELEKQRQLILESNNRKKKANPVEHVIRSERYRYITMPECMLSKGNGVMCSTCRKHLRQLEENEEQRLSELTDEERIAMDDLNLHSDHSSNQSSIPSLVKMSSTLINLTDVSIPSYSPPLPPDPDSSPNELMPVISDIKLPTSHIYRLNYFSSNEHPRNPTLFNPSLRFPCLALCRRDEIEQHWLIHFRIDCILNTSFIQQCPKAQYGCTFQYNRLEPCEHNGQSIRLRFDGRNDALAFEWCPAMLEESNENSGLINLPSELLEKILCRLDSLSLRNISLVCRRLRNLCQDILPSRGIVVTEYERHPSSHGDVTWIERKKHWLFTNTSSAVPNWQLKSPTKLTSLNQHLITCAFGETKDLEKEPPFPLLAWSTSKETSEAIE